MACSCLVMSTWLKIGNHLCIRGQQASKDETQHAAASGSAAVAPAPPSLVGSFICAMAALRRANGVCAASATDASECMTRSSTAIAMEVGS